MKSVCWFAARCRVGVHKGRREMCGWGRSSSSSSSSSSSILYSVGGGYLLASYIGKSSLSRFFRFRHFLLFPFGFHQLVHFFLTVESQDKVGHNWEEQLLGWISGFGAHLTMFLCIIVAALVGLLSRLLMTSKFPTCLPSILYEADSALELVLGVWLYTILQNCCLHRIINLPECHINTSDQISCTSN